MTTTTPRMSLILPDVNSTPGPTWSTLLNAALTTIDGHTHASGSGNQITPSGLNLNADVTLQSNNLTNVRSLRLTNQTSQFSSGSDIYSFYVYNDRPYYRSSAGISVALDGRNTWIQVNPSTSTGHSYRGASISASSTTLTLTVDAGTCVFTAGDVGKAICIAGAGANGADLYTTITGHSSATSVTVNNAASTTVTNSSAWWYPVGQDDTSTIQAAINQASATRGTVYLPAGVYVISSALTSSTLLKGIIGDGRTQTWIITSTNSAKYDMISFSGVPRGVFIKDLALKHAGMATSTATALSTAWSVTSNVVTITATNTFQAGEKIKAIGFLAGKTALNDEFVTLTSASGSSFVFPFTTSDGSGSDVAAFNYDYNCIAFPDGNLRNPTFENLLLMNAPGDGIKIRGIVTGYFKQVLTENCRGNGIALYRSSSDAAAGTSVHFDDCYANGSYLAGYYCRVLNYSTFTSCAADSCGVGYYLYGGASIAMSACGSEVTGYRNAVFPGYHYYVHGTNSAVLNGCYASVNSTTANAASTFLIFDNTSRDCVVNAFKFNGNLAALPTYAFDIKSGCNSIHVIEPNFVNFSTTTGWTNAGTSSNVYFDGAYATQVKTSKRFVAGVNTVSYSATPTLDLSTGNAFKMTLTGDVSSWTVTNMESAAGQELTFVFTQDATGGRTIASIGTNQPYLNMYPNAVTVLKAFCDGTTIYFYSSQQKTTPIQFTRTASDTQTAPAAIEAAFATTHTLPANVLQQNRLIKIILNFSVTTDAGPPPAMNIRVKLGSVDIFGGSGSNVPTTNMSNRPFRLELLVMSKDAVGAAASVFTTPNLAPGTDTAQSPVVPYNTHISTINTNSSQSISAALYASGASLTNSVTLLSMAVEYLD